MLAIRPLIPLLIAAGILLAGNGLQGTLIAIRGSDEGFSTSLIGFIGTAYFIGFLTGSIIISRMLRAVGHIRVFCAMAALAASGSLVMAMIIDPIAWFILRMLTGLCFACLFATVESWINSGVSNAVRGKVLSVYRLVDLGFVTGSQFLIPYFGTDGFVIFSVMAIIIALSLVPVSLADRSNPRPPQVVKFSAGVVWKISPLACIGCIAIGLTGTAFRMIGPIYAQAIGMSVASVATFMSAGIIGGAVLQFPLGAASDKYDRRSVLIVATLGAALSGVFLNFVAGSDPFLNYLGIFVFGAFALPLYSLSAAHANDHASKDEFIQVAAGLMFFWSLGAMIGPFLASILMEVYGPGILFTFTSVIHFMLIIVTLWRMRVRGTVPRDQRGRFVTLLRTSPMMAKLTRRTPGKSDHSSHDDPKSLE